ncbi:elongation of very long chain fatty acids protein AAEL008004-like [Portunus trituberculatus]|nr:elongation of very long chain fatty acids protein AAEL008004-like [Portunus trituberculatus]
MQPHAPAPASAPAPHPTNDPLENLKTTGKWVAVMLTISYMFGDLTVARQLNPDPRMNSWFLMSSPIPTILACFLFVAGVTWWGPQYMRDRKPISGLRPYMMAYNALQVVFSAWLFWEAGMGGWFGSYSFVCQRCDYSGNPQAMRMLRVGYWYLLSKFADFIDTIFFIMNKKNEHVSLLHVCHHSLMPVCMWYGVRHHSGGHTTLLIFLNAFVHTVMYLYYLLAAMGPRVRPFLWWKKYLTTLQIVQFLTVMAQNAMVFFVECAVPPVLLIWVNSMAVLFLILFTDFYIKAYRRTSKNEMVMSSRETSSKLSVQTDATTTIMTDVYRAELVRARTRI